MVSQPRRITPPKASAAPSPDAAPPEAAPPRAAVSEADRLATLAAYGILDSDPEAGFDDIAQLAAHICGTPMAAVTFIDEDRQWFKAGVGLGGVTETDRNVAFCARAIETPDQLLVVPDPTVDARFATNPLVTGDPRIRFYAGAPMVADGGAALGSVCVIDTTPRDLSEEQLESLRALSRQAVALLEARRSLHRLALTAAEREKAQAVARAAVERFHLTFTAAPVGMSIADPDGVYQEVNKAFAGMVGQRPEDLVGKTSRELTAEEDRAAEEDRKIRSLAGEIETMVRQKNYRHVDGSVVPALATTSLVRSADGTPLCYLSHVQEIADRRQAEESLLETQSATDAILTIDSADNIAAWNTGAVRLFGYERVEVLGRPLTIIIPERLRAAHIAGLARVRAGAESGLIGRSTELIGLRRDGSEFPVELSVSRWSRAGESYFTGILRDLSERRRAETHAALIRAAAVAANTAATVSSAFGQVLAEVCGSLGWPVAQAWLIDGRAPERVAQWPAEHEGIAAGERSPDSPVRPGHDGRGLPERVADARAPVMVDPGAVTPALLGVPVSAGDDVVAVLEFVLAPKCAAPDPALRGVLEQVGMQLGRAVERYRAGEEILARSAELAEAQALARLGSWTLDLADGTLNWSDELFRLLGLSPGRVIPSLDAFRDFVHPEDRRLLDRARSSQADGGFEYELRLVRPDGSLRVVQTRGRLVRDAAGRPLRLVGSAQDVTEQRALEQEVLHRAVTDALTGLGNRSMFTAELTAAVAAAARDGRPTVLWVDLDGFKEISDFLGHDVGDSLLRVAAGRLRQAVRPQDEVARVGDNQFAVLLRDTDEPTSMRVAARLRTEIARPANVDGIALDLEASLGVATLDAGTPTDTSDASSAAEPANALIRNAALALEAGQREGKGRIEAYRPVMHSRARRRLSLHAELRHAIARGQLAVHYQPTVDLRSGRLLGAEALLRWTHPELGSVSPAEFVPLAEETGLILELGRWVLTEACRQAAEWSPRRGWAGLPGISVNLSGRQLADERIVHDVTAIVRSTGLEPGRVTLEITESVLMPDVERTTARLAELRESGLLLAIDDFGTGYSSLGYLSRFPVDVLKVDKSFVDDVASSERSRTLAAAVVGLGRTLGVTTLAEGVEREEQRRVLEKLGCQNGQGYLFGRPVAADTFAAALPAPLQVVGGQRAG